MFLSVLTFLTALSISVVAIYYSVAGLVAIFASAAIPVIIMGTTLEIAKLVTAVWLHRYWSQTVWWLKTYLSFAIVLLMVITSMGIFGFLSKAHIDQTATAVESVAVIEQIDSQLLRDQATVKQAEAEIEKLKNQGASQDSQIQSQIDKEQQRIDSAYARIQPAIDEQNKIISKEESRLGAGVNLYKEQVAAIDANLSSIESNIASGNIGAVQALVGVKADGNLGPATERAIEAYRVAQTAERQRLSNLIATESQNITSPVIDAARNEIQRLRSLAESEISSSNELISRLRLQLGTVDQSLQDKDVAAQEELIQTTQKRIEASTQRKFELESEYRKLEAEVGPIKYLAEFVYGTSADKNLLEEAVRWVIVLIIFVFDPLAVLLLIASQYSFKIHKASRQDTKPVPEIIKPDIQSSPTFVPEDLNIIQEEEVVHEDVVQEDIVDKINPRIQELVEKEADEKWKLAKIRWKIDNPRANTKVLRQMYIDGEIENLPWEEYINATTYVQNSEQAQSSLFTKIQQTKNDQN